jgi:hypothetical protein
MKILVINHGLSHLRGCLVNTKTWEIDKYLSLKVEGFSGYEEGEYAAWQSTASLNECLAQILDYIPESTWDYFTVTSSAYNLHFIGTADSMLVQPELILVGDQRCFPFLKDGEKPCDYAPRLRWLRSKYSYFNTSYIADSNSYIAGLTARHISDKVLWRSEPTDPFNFEKFGVTPFQVKPDCMPVGHISGRYILSTYDALTVPFSFPGNEFLAYSAGTCASVRAKTVANEQRYNYPDVGLLGASNNADGATVAWLSKLLGLSPRDLDFKIYASAVDTRTVSSGYLSGSRNPSVRFGSGVLTNLSLLTTPTEIINAVAYSLALDIKKLMDPLPNLPCLVSGGTANQSQLNRLKALVCEKDFYICREKEMTAIGAAAMAIGDVPKFPEIEEVIEWKKLC